MTASLQWLDPAFAWTLRATAQVSAVVLVVFAARAALGGRVGPGARYALWLLLALPLVSPLLPAGPLVLSPWPQRAMQARIAPPPAPPSRAPGAPGWVIRYEPPALPAAPAPAARHRAT